LGEEEGKPAGGIWREGPDRWVFRRHRRGREVLSYLTASALIWLGDRVRAHEERLKNGHFYDAWEEPPEF